MMKAYAVFGIKATTNWKGKVYNARTNEVYNGVTTNISAYFRAYNSFQESISDYFDLICNLDRYKKAKNCKTYVESIKAIANGGYATDPNYADLVIKIINLYDLTHYDYTCINLNYQTGKNYTLQVNLNVRIGAGKFYPLVDFDNMTEDGKKHCVLHGTPILKKGTIVTCKDVILTDDGDIWIKIPSGYIAGIYRGEIYVK